MHNLVHEKSYVDPIIFLLNVLLDEDIDVVQNCDPLDGGLLVRVVCCSRREKVYKDGH